MDFLPPTTDQPQPTVPTLKLRQKIREYTRFNREQLRANALDSLRFGVGEIKTRIQELDNLTEKDVTGLAGRIKRRKHASNEDMYRLSHAFLQDENNIQTFNKIPGAIQVLIKELTGKDAERQMSASECLCNLSLGGTHVCEKISALAGCYLVTYLHTTNTQLVRLCLWTVANILATGHKGASILMKMQLLPQLWKLYVDDAVADSLADYREDSAICLQLLAINSGTLLNPDDRNFVFQHFQEKNPTCLAGEYHLQIVFHVIFEQKHVVETFSKSQVLYLINYSLNNICNTHDFLTSNQHLKVLYSIRILGNLLASHSSSYSVFLQQLSLVWQSNILAILNNLFAFRNPILTQEVLWFLKNILYLENEPLNQTNLLEKLCIFKDIKGILLKME